jgi:putative tryptophan/tyrosine transport system substrate-binding protein
MLVRTMKRRDFITLLGSAATCPLTARAQQGTKLPTVGVLSVATQSAWSTPLSAFVEQLRELGWTDGRTIAIEYRWADGRSERFAELAAELVQLKVDVIVTAGGAVLAAKQATTVIPIVFAVASDPLATGLIASLAHPGSNVTGLSVQATDVAGKRVELLRELFSGIRTLAIMANLGYAAAAREMSEVQAAARSVDFETTTLEIRRAEDIGGSIATLKPGVDILYVCIDPITDTNQILIAASTLAARIPTMPGFRDAVKAGSLIFYGPNIPDLFRRAASFVDKILRGTKAGDIPVEQPTKFDLVINLKTARALGVEIPDKLLALADEVVE